MQVTKEQIDPCKVELTITFEPAVVDAAREKVFQQAAKSVAVPGFRKGHVPPQMARQYVDQSVVKQRAAEQVVQSNYEAALQEAEIEPFAQPELEIVEMNDFGPLVVKATVPLPPVVTLGPYKGLAMERRRPEVGEPEVDKQIEELRSRRAEFPQIENRSAETGDLLLADLGASVLGENGELEDVTEPRETVIEVGKNVPEFDGALVGMTPGERKEIEVTYPADYQDERLQGRTARFDVSLREIRNRILPEMNDEFATKVNPAVTTVAELRTTILENLEKAAERLADMDLEARLLGEIVQNSQIHYPELLLQSEMRSDVESLQERLEANKMTIEDYLIQNNVTEEQVEQQIAVNSDTRIRNSLALSQIAQAEAITLTDDDLTVQINRRAEQTKVSPAAVRAYAEKNNQIEGMRNAAMTEKIIGFLKESATITNRIVTREELESGGGNEETDETLAELAEEIAEEESAQNAPLSIAGAPVKRRKAVETEQENDA